MPRKSGKVTEAELAICRRLKSFREWIGLSQAEVASEILVGRDLIASVEYGRTPLKYGLACRILNLFELNPEWIATGKGPIGGRQGVPLPEDVGANKNELFSAVYRAKLQALQKTFSAGLVDPERRHGWISIVPDAAGRLCAEEWILRDLRDCLARIPNIQLDDLVNGVAHFLACFLENIEPETIERSNKRREEIEVARLNLEQRRVYLNLKRKSILDIMNPLLHSGGVQNDIRDLKGLIARLKKVTVPRGAKAALAREFKVTRQAVNQWLSGESNPSADIAIRLQYWKPKLPGK